MQVGDQVSRYGFVTAGETHSTGYWLCSDSDNLIDKKTIALLKLIYLEMFGYDMSWASFHVLEVMSSTKHLQKRIGYLAAAQSFRAETEVLMLATNLLKKVNTNLQQNQPLVELNLMVEFRI